LGLKEVLSRRIGAAGKDGVSRISARALVQGNHVLSVELFEIDSFINIKLYIESCRLYVK
jgi:hypothetical protein